MEIWSVRNMAWIGFFLCRENNLSNRLCFVWLKYLLFSPGISSRPKRNATGTCERTSWAVVVEWKTSCRDDFRLNVWKKNTSWDTFLIAVTLRTALIWIVDNWIVFHVDRCLVDGHNRHFTYLFCWWLVYRLCTLLFSCLSFIRFSCSLGLSEGGGWALLSSLAPRAVKHSLAGSPRDQSTIKQPLRLAAATRWTDWQAAGLLLLFLFYFLPGWTEVGIVRSPCRNGHFARQWVSERSI